ncbi:MAG: hypothetical protein NUV60_00935, partial [Patescibacteria group bacterium]|nr:hypothetical protein [Patescibacteria group bacterium]
MLPFFEHVVKWRDEFTGKTGVRLEPYPLLVASLALLFVSYVFMPNIVALAFSIALFVAPVWLPFLLVGGAFSLWIVLRRSEFIAGQKYILLEIKP